MRQIEFSGMTFEYDEKALRRYDVQKYLALADEDIRYVYKAFDIIFAGHDIEYAKQLENDDAAMVELFKAVVQSVADGNDETARAVKN